MPNIWVGGENENEWECVLFNRPFCYLIAIKQKQQRKSNKTTTTTVTNKWKQTSQIPFQ